MYISFQKAHFALAEEAIYFTDIVLYFLAMLKHFYITFFITVLFIDCGECWKNGFILGLSHLLDQLMFTEHYTKIVNEQGIEFEKIGARIEDLLHCWDFITGSICRREPKESGLLVMINIKELGDSPPNRLVIVCDELLMS